MCAQQYLRMPKNFNNSCADSCCQLSAVTQQKPQPHASLLLTESPTPDPVIIVQELSTCVWHTNAGCGAEAAHSHDPTWGMHHFLHYFPLVVIALQRHTLGSITQLRPLPPTLGGNSPVQACFRHSMTVCSTAGCSSGKLKTGRLQQRHLPEQTGICWA